MAAAIVEALELRARSEKKDVMIVKVKCVQDRDVRCEGVDSQLSARAEVFIMRHTNATCCLTPSLLTSAA